MKETKNYYNEFKREGRIEEYRKVVGDETIDNIKKKARELEGKHIVHINSTYQGGGVAEMLVSLVPLMNDIGIKTGWRLLHGTPDFFSITKKFHNALQGASINLTEIKKNIYCRMNADFSIYTHLNHDCVIVHDPQPLPLIKFYEKKQPWIWRCHIDLSNPNNEIWSYMKDFIEDYDEVVVSKNEYKHEGLKKQKIIWPSIDPLDPKNKELEQDEIEKLARKYDIPRDKPIISQVSRFDKWKDPEGLIEVFKKVRKKVKCRLILCGSMASDDTEGREVYERVRKKAGSLIKKGDIILITEENDILVNLIQRISSVVIQKSLKEGFGLTVTEALWKGKPVIASSKGGIPLQIKNRENGILQDPEDFKAFTREIINILKNPSEGKKIGENGKEVVRKNFLITRHLEDYVDLLKEVL